MIIKISITILFFCSNLYCSEFKEFIENNLSLSFQEVRENNNHKKKSLCWKNDWYVLSAMCLSGAAGITGSIAILPCLLFENYSDVAFYAGTTTASIATIWVLPQGVYLMYKGYKYLRKQYNKKALEL